MANVIILGAGISGLSAAYHAKIRGINATVYEKENYVGGLTSSFLIDGFRFDNAVHLSFTKNEYVRSVFDKTDCIEHTPSAFCYENKLWFRHPIQNNLYPLPVSERVDLVESFVNRPHFESNNYKEWLICQYGEKIAERYPISYTNKYWCTDAERLSTSWIGNRMRRAEIREVLEGAFQDRDVNHYYASEMRYPKKGGYESFLKPISVGVDVRLNHCVKSIDTVERKVEFECGTIVSYDNLISSLPLPVIISKIKSVPDEVRKAANSLLFTRVDLISVAFNKRDIPPHLWFYIYGDKVKAARAYSPSMKSPDNVPEGCSSLQFEIYSLSTEPRHTPDDLKKNVLNTLYEMEICIAEDILFTHHKHLPFGNVVFDHGMEQRRTIVHDFLESAKIKSCGRFGEWDYLWSDQAFMSGKAAAEEVEKKC